MKRAFDLTGRQPEIFNTDQGSQFTSQEWVSEIEGRGIKVSMDGKRVLARQWLYRASVAEYKI